MKKLVFATAVVAAAALFGSAAMAGKPSTKGNGLPLISMQDSWQLSIHAYDTCPTNPYDNTMRRTIVVQASGVSTGAAHPDSTTNNDINLEPNDTDSFQVVDGNACDDDPALLSLPQMVASDYELFIKYIGKPGTKLDPTLCATDGTTTYCNLDTSVHTRTTGNGSMKFTDATRDLLGGIPDPGTTGGGLCSGNYCDLFDPGLFGYFWDWSATSGAKAILVFVPCATSKTSSDPAEVSCFN